MKKLLLISMLLFSSASMADESTQVREAFKNISPKPTYYLPHVATLLHLGDWYTTSRTIGDPRYREANPILGEHPTNRQLNALAITELAIHYIMNQTKFAHKWNIYLTTVKSYAVINNLYVINKVERRGVLGLGINYKWR